MGPVSKEPVRLAAGIFAVPMPWNARGVGGGLPLGGTIPSSWVGHVVDCCRSFLSSKPRKASLIKEINKSRAEGPSPKTKGIPS